MSVQYIYKKKILTFDKRTVTLGVQHQIDTKLLRNIALHQ